MSGKAKNIVERLLAQADIRINGDRPWDIKIHNENVFKRVLLEGSVGIGEAYMDGWWDAEQLDELLARALKKRLSSDLKVNLNTLLYVLGSRIFNLQSKGRAYHVAEHHYNLGNDLFISMLDKRMNYSCGYWKNARNLDEAQEAKLDLICNKLDLKPGQRILDIGCGWGAFVKYAAEKYKVEAVGITVSKEQLELAKEKCKGLPIELRLQDYRDPNEQFDHVVSIGMFEHVGHKNYRTYMEVVRRCLKDDGLFLLHTIGGNFSDTRTDPWLNKYIFPNGMLPSIAQIGKAIEELFVMEDWHNFGADYEKTIMAWHHNFITNWEKIKHNYDARFFRMWKLYLLSCAALFRIREVQLWQVVLSKSGVPGNYTSVR